MKKSKVSEIAGWVFAVIALVAMYLEYDFIGGAFLVATLMRWWDAKHEAIHEELTEIKERLPKPLPKIQPPSPKIITRWPK